MATTTFTNGATLTDAGWFNDLDMVGYDGLTTQILVGGGAGVAAVWTAATGSGAPARAGTPSFTTTIGVGAATASASGSGISFPATQSASTDVNTLDDYEEGSITPTVLSGGNQVGRTYATQSGSYTKIGNSVKFRVKVVLSALGSSTGATTVAITGAPTSANTHLIPVVVLMADGPAGVTTAPLGYLDANSTSVVLVSFAAGTVTALTETAIDADTGIYISGEYAV